MQLLGDRNLRLADASLRAGGSGNSGRITLRSTAESLSIDGSTLAAGNLDLQSATATAITDSSLDTGRSDTSSQLLIRGRGISLTEATLRAGTVTLTDSATLTLRSGTDDDRLRIYWADGSTTDLPCTKEQATLVCG